MSEEKNFIHLWTKKCDNESMTLLDEVKDTYYLDRLWFGLEEDQVVY